MKNLLEKRKAYSANSQDVGTRARMLVWLIYPAAFLVRLLVRTSYGEDYFWKSSYSLFYDLARNIAAGRGLCYEWYGTKWAQRPPIYPLFLVISVLGGKPYITIVILQSLTGAGTALCAFLIGRKLFDKRIGLLAGIGVAFYPYFVMHDTALQETGLFTFLTALTILLLLQSKDHSSVFVGATAGIALALAVLTRLTLLVFVPFAFMWVLFYCGRTRREMLQRFGVISIAFMLLVAPWVLRNYLILGRPTFSTLTGLTLWAGNNPYTFSKYPSQSIDLSVNDAMESLRPEERERILQLSNDEIAQNTWFLNKGLEYIRNNPAQTLSRSLNKTGAGFSWHQNPPPGRFAQTVYLLSYAPILLLGITGAWMARKNWKEQSLIYALFLSFIVVTAIFFAHTSHRSYLDVYLIVFSASALPALRRIVRDRRRPV